MIAALVARSGRSELTGPIRRGAWPIGWAWDRWLDSARPLGGPRGCGGRRHAEPGALLKRDLLALWEGSKHRLVDLFYKYDNSRTATEGCTEGMTRKMIPVEVRPSPNGSGIRLMSRRDALARRHEQGARPHFGLTQAQLAQRMHTTRQASDLLPLESGRVKPSSASPFGALGRGHVDGAADFVRAGAGELKQLRQYGRPIR
jgi:DNA-binding XRE family transcriptional regulator